MTNKKVKNMLQLYSILDLKENSYGRPMCFSNHDHAKQAILKQFLLQNPNEELDPSNYEIHYLGDFIEGEILNTDDSEYIATVSEIVKIENDKTLEEIRKLTLDKSELNKHIAQLKIEKDLLVHNQLKTEESKL